MPDFPLTKHTELTDKEVAGVIDHDDLSVTDEKLKSGVGLQDTQICKLPTATPDKILKRGAAAWEAGDVPPPVLEGDYSNWAIYDSFDDPDAWILADYAQYAVGNRDETKIVLFDIRNNRIKEYDIATKTLTDLGFTAPVMAWGSGENPPRRYSAYGTYFVVVENYDDVRIIKNGAVIKTLTYADLGIDSGEIYTANISPKGKYIAISGKRTATGNPGWVILEGS